MSSRNAAIDEAELDAILRGLLARPVHAPVDRITNGAMAQVRTTPQVRRPIVVSRWPRIRLAPIGAVAVAVLAVAVGLNLVVAPTAPAGPSPSPTATGAPPPASVLVGGPADGYQMLVPGSWAEIPTGFADAREWQGADARVMVSYGASIFEGGGVTRCGPSKYLSQCATQTYRYSIPYDPSVDGIGPLAIDDDVRDMCDGGCDVSVTETTLGGEQAQRAFTVASGSRATYVATFHDRRPVIVHWSEPATAVDDPTQFDAMLASFTFVDPKATSPSPFLDPTELVPYVNADLGYEVLIPRFMGNGGDHAGASGVRDFGSGRGFGTRGFPALSISVGSADGRVTLCQGEHHVCEAVVVNDLDDLEASLVSVMSNLPQSHVVGDLVLAGHDGRFKRPRPEVQRRFLGRPGMLYHAYTLHDGRPVVISIDWWTIAFDELPTTYVAEILSSFRFLD